MHVTISDKDEYYRFVLEGLARYLEVPFLDDLNRTIAKYPRPDLPNALSKNQVASKRWLMEELHQAVGPNLGVVYILGGWYGFLGAMLLHDNRFSIDQIISVDLNPTCQEVAESLNHTHVCAQRFRALTADMCELDYGGIADTTPAPRNPMASPDVVINTSCEHLTCYHEWYQRVPGGMTVVLQSNNDFDCPVHVNCVPDLEAFKLQSPLSELLFAGTLRHKHYDRFMLIGRK